jgi:enolase
MLSRLNSKYGLDVTLFGNEGRFAPNILNSKECLRLIETAINPVSVARSTIVVQ